MSEPRFVEARPINGYLPHAIRYQPEFFTRTAPFIVVTYLKALCGVGRGGMRLRLDHEGEPKDWVGIDGCDTCHTKMRKLRAGGDS
jgi:hypothetical protein